MQVKERAGIWSTRFNMRPGVIQNILGVLVPTGKWTSFPLTLWLVYPSLGRLFGEFLMKCKDIYTCRDDQTEKN